MGLAGGEHGWERDLCEQGSSLVYTTWCLGQAGLGSKRGSGQSSGNGLEAGAVTCWNRAWEASGPVPEGSMYASVRIDGGLQTYCYGVCDLAAFISLLP